MSRRSSRRSRIRPISQLSTRSRTPIQRPHLNPSDAAPRLAVTGRSLRSTMAVRSVEDIEELMRQKLATQGYKAREKRAYAVSLFEAAVASESGLDRPLASSTTRAFGLATARRAPLTGLRLNKHQFGLLLDRINLPVNGRQLAGLFARTDRDGDGFVSLDDFVEHLVPLASAHPAWLSGSGSRPNSRRFNPALHGDAAVDSLTRSDLPERFQSRLKQRIPGVNHLYLELYRLAALANQSDDFSPQRRTYMQPKDFGVLLKQLGMDVSPEQTKQLFDAYKKKGAPGLTAQDLLEHTLPKSHHSKFHLRAHTPVQSMYVDPADHPQAKHFDEDKVDKDHIADVLSSRSVTPGDAAPIDHPQQRHFKPEEDHVREVTSRLSSSLKPEKVDHAQLRHFDLKQANPDHVRVITSRPNTATPLPAMQDHAERHHFAENEVNADHLATIMGQNGAAAAEPAEFHDHAERVHVKRVQPPVAKMRHDGHWHHGRRHRFGDPHKKEKLTSMTSRKSKKPPHAAQQGVKSHKAHHEHDLAMHPERVPTPPQHPEEITQMTSWTSKKPEHVVAAGVAGPHHEHLHPVPKTKHTEFVHAHTGFTAKEEVPHTLHGSHSAGLEKIVAKVTGHELDEAHHKHTNGHSKRHGKNPKQGDVPVGLRVETQRRMAHTLDLFWKLHGMGMVGPNATPYPDKPVSNTELSLEEFYSVLTKLGLDVPDEEVWRLYSRFKRKGARGLELQRLVRAAHSQWLDEKLKANDDDLRASSPWLVVDRNDDDVRIASREVRVPRLDLSRASTRASRRPKSQLQPRPPSSHAAHASGRRSRTPRPAVYAPHQSRPSTAGAAALNGNVVRRKANGRPKSTRRSSVSAVRPAKFMQRRPLTGSGSRRTTNIRRGPAATLSTRRRPWMGPSPRATGRLSARLSLRQKATGVAPVLAEAGGLRISTVGAYDLTARGRPSV